MSFNQTANVELRLIFGVLRMLVSNAEKQPINSWKGSSSDVVTSYLNSSMAKQS